jgi:hypothetical protein
MAARNSSAKLYESKKGRGGYEDVKVVSVVRVVRVVKILNFCGIV